MAKVPYVTVPTVPLVTLEVDVKAVEPEPIATLSAAPTVALVPKAIPFTAVVTFAILPIAMAESEVASMSSTTEEPDRPAMAIEFPPDALT
ncbi:hypothetical protein [Ephemeroptericola cinctiostellae]|uniref:hypothetical protein n=1 Tax=Ephemeroptericola cinctiostellae TaxID=2268024 RepID=UPI0013004493|nr:hypothetical protein [Ephemeroptericola cinctiostellae]